MVGKSIALPAIAILTVIAITVTSKMEEIFSPSKASDGKVTVVPGLPGSSIAIPTALLKGDIPYKPPLSREAANLPAESPISRLHEMVMSEEKDRSWGGIATREIKDAVQQAPYLSDDAAITCGTIRCELSVTLERGISNHNADFVASKFYSIKSDEDGMGLMVEGVFPTTDLDGSKRISVIYLRR